MQTPKELTGNAAETHTEFGKQWTTGWGAEGGEGRLLRTFPPHGTANIVPHEDCFSKGAAILIHAP